ncbi:UDP-N-acetyl-D-glucosamine 2-epimerase, UDP-hydrolysing [Candidatus Desulfarcum epimagneticum]|uniref:UDP-N-acetyl-D-glucosamine 2-epimerase, UDP-hydrolysing n=1 Tax=uncultured Desulfobacteraceae bacterium TaxID=218296 RepID=A0A484HJ44_9BACT|nr:UDP-N-acetyl-D-glucosamine 2-epimerase, UDP-hydrolysing [uncultured Desulfobacteraceae bacterium]
MKKIAVFTTTRAEFGIFLPLLKKIESTPDLEFLLFVGGSHLAWEHGRTINEIREYGFEPAATFDYLLNDDKKSALAKSAGIAVIELSHIFLTHDFDSVCLLGDRHELLSIMINSILFKKPIIHIHGGEITEGAIDEQIRHIATKASHIHFAACDEYKKNIRLLGESEWRIFNTGALAVDNMINNPKIPRESLFGELKLQDQKTALCTYHPVTLEYKIGIEQQVKNLISALKKAKLQVVFTAPNIEVDREMICGMFQKEAKTNSDFHYFDSLGVLRYHSLIPHCECVIGNSSSGILEVPFFKIPTVNIGDRQKGRLRHDSVIDTDYTVESIHSGIRKALSCEFKKKLADMEYKFGDGSASEKMVAIIKEIEVNEKLMRKTLDFS